MKKLKPSEQQVLQNWQWLYTQGYKLGYADGKDGRENQTKLQPDEITIQDGPHRILSSGDNSSSSK